MTKLIFGGCFFSLGYLSVALAGQLQAGNRPLADIFGFSGIGCIALALIVPGIMAAVDWSRGK